jgi:hypothetical protein
MTEPKGAPLFTSKFSQGRRTFFFDVKKSKSEKPFLKITSSSIKGEEKQRTNLMVFDNEIPEFCQSVMDAANFILSL